MINTHWLELPPSRASFPGSMGVRTIEVQLYIVSGTSSYPHPLWLDGTRDLIKGYNLGLRTRLNYMYHLKI